MNNTIVYRHRRLDTFEVFYVGIGKHKHRPYQKSGRNQFWKNITNKTEFTVEILKTDLSWEDACELEMFLIQQYGRLNKKTGILCNLTDGGEGAFGLEISEERRKKVSEFHKGRKRSKETIAKKRLFGKPVYCTNTNKQWINIKSCALELGIKYTTLSCKLQDQNKNDTTIKYVIND